MKCYIIFLSLVSTLLCNLAIAQINPQNYHIIYGNRDGTPMSVQLGSIINLPIWSTTDYADSIDTVATMFDPLKSIDAIVPQRLGGECIICPSAFCYFGDPSHQGGYTTQPYFFIGNLGEQHCYFITLGDTVEVGYFSMSLTNDSSYLGQTVCPFAEDNSALWGFADGLHQVIPVSTYSCLYFTTCNAIPGDANGDGVFNAIDIVYGVNYLKGSGDPPQSWDCPGHGSVYVGADANGNCVFNGLDITYCVNYLRGRGPAPRRCPSC